MEVRNEEMTPFWELSYQEQRLLKKKGTNKEKLSISITALKGGTTRPILCGILLLSIAQNQKKRSNK